ncbi:MAG TPA: ABC transporter ATP-binding protein [Stellaceae bacterium]|nr:ABC transporter ATP-binding protein [Stellaceae bacterium]
MTLLDVNSISVARGEVDVLRGISITVQKGELLAILGPNGAGKTTLLRTLSGLIRAHAGTVRFDGNDITGEPPHRIARGGLVHVPEGRGVLPELTVQENLALGMVTHGWRGRKPELERIFELFPILRSRADQSAGMLSGGEQQMLSIARSLLCRPRLLMVDELSLGLAPKITLELMALLARISRSGPTVMIVEQNAQQALRFADRIYVLSQGAVALSGSSAELARDPELLAAYLGRA